MPLTQREITEHIITLTDEYRTFAREMANFRELPFVPPMIETIIRTPAPKAGMPDLPRVDRSGFFGELHQEVRGTGDLALDDVHDARWADPDNAALTAVAYIASDIYSAFSDLYKAGQKVESRFKRRVRAADATEFNALLDRYWPTKEIESGKPANEKDVPLIEISSGRDAVGKVLRREDARPDDRDTQQILWNAAKKNLLRKNAEVAAARVQLKDLLLLAPDYYEKSGKALEAIAKEAEDEAEREAAKAQQKAQEIDRVATIMRDYRGRYKHLTDAQMINAVVIAKTIAAYAFAGRHRANELSDPVLNEALHETFQAIRDGGRAIAGIYDELHAAPYYAENVGLDPDEIGYPLGRQARVIGVFSEAGKLLTGRQDILVNSLNALEELGLGEPAWVESNLEMAVLIGACAYNQHNDRWMDVSRRILEAETRGALQAVLSDDLTLAVLSEIQASGNPEFGNIKTLLANALEEADELRIVTRPDREEDVSDERETPASEILEGFVSLPSVRVEERSDDTYWIEVPYGGKLNRRGAEDLAHRIADAIKDHAVVSYKRNQVTVRNPRDGVETVLAEFARPARSR